MRHTTYVITDRPHFLLDPHLHCGCAVEDEHKDKRPSTRVDLSIGLGGLFQGLGSLIDAATALTNAAASESSPAQTILGASVRVAPRRQPGVPRFVGSNRHARKEASAADAREPMTDVLDEGDHFLVIAEMPGLADSAAQWTVANDRQLIIRGESADRKYFREVPLPTAVDATRATSSCCNGVLELKLWKHQTR